MLGLGLSEAYMGIPFLVQNKMIMPKEIRLLDHPCLI